jgi:hypothetical protein
LLPDAEAISSGPNLPQSALIEDYLKSCVLREGLLYQGAHWNELDIFARVGQRLSAGLAVFLVDVEMNC